MSLITDNEKVKFLVRGDVKPPKRDAGYDAGIDVYMPNLTEQFLVDFAQKNPGHMSNWGLVGGATSSEEDGDKNEQALLFVAPGADVLIPTYLSARIPENMYLKVANKSGVCTKQKLVVGADTIDASYEGIIHVHLFNDSNTVRYIKFGQSIAQLIPTLIDKEEIEVWYESDNKLFEEMKNQCSTELFYENHKSKRCEKGFGTGSANDKDNPK